MRGLSPFSGYMTRDPAGIFTVLTCPVLISNITNQRDRSARCGYTVLRSQGSSLRCYLYADYSAMFDWMGGLGKLGVQMLQNKIASLGT